MGTGPVMKRITSRVIRGLCCLLMGSGFALQDLLLHFAPSALPDVEVLWRSAVRWM